MTKTRIDFRFIQIEYELWAIGQFLDIVEPQIKFLTDQDPLRTFAKLRAGSYDDADIDFATQELRERKKYVIPRFMRGSFLVALWACYEAGITELAAYRQSEIGAKIDINELRAGDFLSRARRYFDAVLSTSLDLIPERLSRLSDTYQVRNAFAHANGQQGAMSEKAWRRLEPALKRLGIPPDQSRGSGLVIPSETFLRQAFDDANGSLRALMARLRGSP